MPIYEYRCQACDHRFEALVMGAQKPVCPECGSPKLEKQFSTFGLGGGANPGVSRPAWGGG
jgi:putative FmdB family regulatory protein